MLVVRGEKERPSQPAGPRLTTFGSPAVYWRRYLMVDGDSISWFPITGYQG